MTTRIALLISPFFAAAFLASAGTLSISQTHETEPNNAEGQATPLNDNSGVFQCAFLQPADDDFYEFTTTVDNSVLTVEAVGAPFVADTFLTIEDAGGAPLAFVDGGGTLDNAKITNLTLPTAGTYYVWVSESTSGFGAGYTYTLSGQIVEPDIVDILPPFYPNAAGILYANRVSSTSVEAIWNQAADDISFASDIRYNIYYDTTAAGVFAGPPKLTLTGVLYATLDGLDLTQPHYFGVRAEDEAGNEETNTETWPVVLPTAARPDLWPAYD